MNNKDVVYIEVPTEAERIIKRLVIEMHVRGFYKRDDAIPIIRKRIEALDCQLNDRTCDLETYIQKCGEKRRLENWLAYFEKARR